MSAYFYFIYGKSTVLNFSLRTIYFFCSLRKTFFITQFGAFNTFMLNCNQSRLCLLEHRRTDRPGAGRRLLQGCRAGSSSAAHDPSSRSSCPVYSCAFPTTWTRPWSRRAWRRPCRGLSTWWSGGSTRGPAAAWGGTPTSRWWSPRGFSSSRPSRASAFLASSACWDHDADPFRWQRARPATGSRTRACTTSRPDSSTWRPVLRSAGGACGADERTVSGSGGLDGARDHWQWTNWSWPRPSLSCAVVTATWSDSTGSRWRCCCWDCAGSSCRVLRRKR